MWSVLGVAKDIAGAMIKIKNGAGLDLMRKSTDNVVLGRIAVEQNIASSNDYLEQIGSKNIFQLYFQKYILRRS